MTPRPIFLSRAARIERRARAVLPYGVALGVVVVVLFLFWG